MTFAFTPPAKKDQLIAIEEGRRICLRNIPSKTYRFPLTDRQLPVLELDKTQYKKLEVEIEQISQDALSDSGLSWELNPTEGPQYNKDEWEILNKRKDGMVCRLKKSVSNISSKIKKSHNTLKLKEDSHSILMRTTSTASLNDISYGLLCGTTEHHRNVLAHIYGEGFLDGSVIQVIESPTPSDPFRFLGIKWAAFKTPINSNYAIWDTLYIEYTKTVSDAQGNRTLVRILHSIDCAHQIKQMDFGFVRLNICQIQLFRQIQHNKSLYQLNNRRDNDIVLTASVNMQLPKRVDKDGSPIPSPPWLSTVFYDSVTPFLDNFSFCGDAKFISSKRLLSNIIENTQRQKSCHSCLKSFTIFSARLCCQICGNSMCLNCNIRITFRTSELPVNLQPDDSYFVASQNICGRCIRKGQDDRENRTDRLNESVRSRDSTRRTRHKAKVESPSSLWPTYGSQNMHRTDEQLTNSIEISFGSSRDSRQSALSSHSSSRVSSNSNNASSEGIPPRHDQIAFMESRHANWQARKAAPREQIYPSIYSPQNQVTSPRYHRQCEYEKMTSVADYQLPLPNILKLEESIAHQQALIQSLVIQTRKQPKI